MMATTKTKEGVYNHIAPVFLIAGIAVAVIIALLMFIGLATYSPDDSAWHVTNNNPTQNFLGTLGAWYSDITLSVLGYASYLIPIGIITLCVQFWLARGFDKELLSWRLAMLCLAILSGSVLASKYFTQPINEFIITGGGYLGQWLTKGLESSVSSIPVIMLLTLLVFVLSLTILFSIPWLKVIEGIGAAFTFLAIKTFAKKPKKQPSAEPASDILKNNANLLDNDEVEPETQNKSPLYQKPAPTISRYQGEIEDENNRESDIAFTEDFRQSHTQEEEKASPSFTTTSFTTTDKTNKQEPTFFDFTHDDNPDALEDYVQPISLLTETKDDKTDVEGTQYPPVNLDEENTAVSSGFFHDLGSVSELDDLIVDSASEPSNTRSDTDAIAFDVQLDEPLDETDLDESAFTQRSATASTSTATIKKTTHTTIGKQYRAEEETPQKVVKEHALPDLELLNVAPLQQDAYTEEDLVKMSLTLENALQQYNISATVMNVSPGPVITRFEIELAPGVQAKKITALTTDLARALAVSSVRVEEVIPGSSYVGLEVPNTSRQTVYFKSILVSKQFREAKSPLTLALGSDISGKPVVADLMKMPHLLVAGTTGSGKSVAINSMLLSMLYKSKPSDLRLILVDPKMLEMSMYEDIPHLLTPVITDMNDAENALTWAVAEMERRYKLMASLKVRKIDSLNEYIDEAIAVGQPIKDPLWEPNEHVGYTHHPDLERLPYIVIVIDELADMMMVVGKQVEQLIARLTQKARAAGIHVVLATQRPSVDVLTGLIKANVPTRIAFQVSSKVDSRTIIDGMGAENLLGHGDMLYVPPGVSHPKRLHGAFVSDEETDRVTTFLRTTGEPDYINGITAKQDPETLGAFGAAEVEAREDADPLYEEAVQIVISTGKASISSVQRQLRIGYNRAARMIEEMEQQGIVSEPINGIRKVLGGSGQH